MSLCPMPMPFSWYFVHYSDQLKKGDVVSLKYFGRDLVLFRTKSGKAQLLDAYCPHLGAHLGVGGFVDGESVVCPFHNWAWNGKGKCTHIPYTDNMPPRVKTLRLRHYHVVEKNQIIWAWFHPEDAEPSLEIPDIPQTEDPQWGPAHHFHWIVKAHMQEMAENSVDAAHFVYVHGGKTFPKWKEEFKGVNYASSMDFKAPSREGLVDCRINVNFYTPGLSTTHFSGVADVLLLGLDTPVDPQTTAMRFSFFHKRDKNGELNHYGKAFEHEICRQVEQDKPIWEHKAYCPRPLLCDKDGKIMEFRRHYNQFYVNYDEKERLKEMTERGEGRIYTLPATAAAN